jgi:hypothetical protein
MLLSQTEVSGRLRERPTPFLIFGGLMGEDAARIADALLSKLPRCPECGKPLECIEEDIAGVRYTWEYDYDKGKYRRVETDHYGDTEAYCCYCGAPSFNSLCEIPKTT